MFRIHKAPRLNSGQSTVEYILIVTAVIATVVLVSGKLGTKLENTLNTTINGIVDKGNTLVGSHEDTVASTEPKVTILSNSEQPLQ